MDTIQSTCFNYNGTLVATTCKDKHVRIFDIRSGQMVQEGESHSGVKSSYVTWLGDSNRILTTGFSRSSDRQVGIWDTSSLKSYLKMENLDTSSGSLVPHYDLDTKMLYLSGKVLKE
jgi:coronin-1B/1C/6